MKNNRHFGAILSLSLAVAMPTVLIASPEFLAYEGRNAIHDGQGGEKKNVEGVDFWFNGDPPHRFKVLGAITDRRMKTGIYGMIRMSGLEPEIAKLAKNAGGDARVEPDERHDLVLPEVAVLARVVHDLLHRNLPRDAPGLEVGCRRRRRRCCDRA